MSTGLKRDFSESGAGSSNEHNKSNSDEIIFKVPEPPCKKVNLLGAKDDLTPKLGQHFQADHLLPGFKIEQLLSLLKRNELGELEKELVKLQANEDNSHSLTEERSTQKLLTQAAELEEKLEKTESRSKMLVKQNSLLELGFQENQSAFKRWVNYLDSLPDFDTPQKLYKSYLDASIESADFLKAQVSPVEHIEQLFEILFMELNHFHKKTNNALAFLPGANLNAPFEEFAEVTNAVMKSSLEIIQNLFDECKELQQSSPPLEIIALQKADLIKELIQWKSKVGQLEVKVREEIMDSHLSSPIRVLQLRKNPIYLDVSPKANLLDKLMKENVRLCELSYENPSLDNLVSSDRLQLAMQGCADLRTKNEGLEVQAIRMTKIFADKALEFSQSISTIFGYDIELKTENLYLLKNQHMPFYIELELLGPEKKQCKINIFGTVPEYLKGIDQTWLVENKSVPGFFNALMSNHIHEMLSKTDS